MQASCPKMKPRPGSPVDRAARAPVLLMQTPRSRLELCQRTSFFRTSVSVHAGNARARARNFRATAATTLLRDALSALTRWCFTRRRRRSPSGPGRWRRTPRCCRVAAINIHASGSRLTRTRLSFSRCVPFAQRGVYSQHREGRGDGKTHTAREATRGRPYQRRR